MIVQRVRYRLPELSMESCETHQPPRFYPMLQSSNRTLSMLSILSLLTCFGILTVLPIDDLLFSPCTSCFCCDFKCFDLCGRTFQAYALCRTSLQHIDISLRALCLAVHHNPSMSSTEVQNISLLTCLVLCEAPALAHHPRTRLVQYQGQWRLQAVAVDSATITGRD